MIRRSTLEKTADDLTFIASLPTSWAYEVPFQTEELLCVTQGVILPVILTIDETPKFLTMKSEIEAIGFSDDLFIPQKVVVKRKSTLDEISMAEAERNADFTDGVPE